MSSRRRLLISIWAITAAGVIAGCAAPATAPSTGGVSTTGAGSAGPASSTGGAPATGVASAGPSSAPVGSIPPIGPAATAATGSPPRQGDHASATVGGVTISCPSAGAEPALQQESPAPLPPDLSVRAVVRCENVSRSYPGLGQWSVQLAEVADQQDFAPLIAELRKPSAPLTTEPCAAIGQVLPWIEVVDSSGQVIRPALPTGECGLVDKSVIAAVQHLDYRAVDAVRVAQTLSPEAISSGCDQRWKDIVALAGQSARLPDSAGKLDSTADLASSPASVRVCLYSAGPSDHGLRAGNLIKGLTVSGPQAAALAAGASAVLAVPSGCADATRFATLTYGRGRVDYVELGGCDRVLTNDGQLGTASDSLIATLRDVLG